jgi:hypothetical protein
MKKFMVKHHYHYKGGVGYVYTTDIVETENFKYIDSKEEHSVVEFLNLNNEPVGLFSDVYAVSII